MAIVEEPRLRLLAGCGSIYDIANSAIAGGLKMSDAARQQATDDVLDYEPIYRGQSEWRILPPIDHPGEPARCLLSGTGLTHLGSARNRQSMHATTDEKLTDSMRMFRCGIEGGRPAPGTVGTAPEWFYKGTGTSLRAHGRAARNSALRGGWRRRSGDCRCLPDCIRRPASPDRNGRAATNSQIIASRRRTISISQVPSCERALLVPNLWLTRLSDQCRWM